MEELRNSNGKKIAKILDYTGNENSSITIEEDWEIRIYHSTDYEDREIIEMCSYADYNGDALFDPLFRIELYRDENGELVSAKALYYLSRTFMGDIELYCTGNPDCWSNSHYEEDEGELDERLSSWMRTIDMRGYLTKGKVTRI